MCVVCRVQRPRPELLRLVRPTGRTDIIADPLGSTAGKGVYLCRRTECLTRLQRERRLRKLFGGRLAPEAVVWMEQELAEA